MGKIRIAIVEDERSVSEALITYFEAGPEIEVVNCSIKLEDFFHELPLPGQVDIILLDLNLPGMDGVQGIPLLKEKLPGAEIVVLSTYDDNDHIFSALKAGAIAYISKRTPLDKIKEGIITVAQGGSYMSPTIAIKIAQYFNRTNTAPFEDFTARQKQIVDGLVDGKRYEDIAQEYIISVETVRDHIKKIYKKLHINSRGELMKLSFQNRRP